MAEFVRFMAESLDVAAAEVLVTTVRTGATVPPPPARVVRRMLQVIPLFSLRDNAQLATCPLIGHNWAC
jgi:hypothetical protein